jgi:WS/DGAT/MGAT family acyltransferase
MELIESHIGQADAFTVSLERDPLLRSTIVAVAVFEITPDFDTLVARVDRATRLVPTFRQRLIATPLGLAPPRWSTDPAFDLRFHVRRIAPPEPRTLESVFEIARTMGMAAFDPARPLWEMTLVEGMANGRAALIMKVHHALTDGIGGIQIAAHVVDLEAGPVDVGLMPDVPTPAERGPLDDWIDVVTYDATHVARATQRQVASLASSVGTVLRHPIRSTLETAATVAAVGRFLRPVTETKSPVMSDRRLSWHFCALDVDLPALKAGSHAAGGTLNDGFLAALAGGLQRYHLRHGQPVEALRLTMPISVRTADDDEGGNHITLVRFEAPTSIDDPVERLSELGRRCTALRQDRALPFTEAMAGVLNLLPISITGGMLKHVDFLASNVPGFELPVFVGGARLEAFYPFGPTLGSAANITLMSYGRTCNVGINTDVGAVSDPDVLRACLAEGFEEICELGGSLDAVRLVGAV